MIGGDQYAKSAARPVFTTSCVVGNKNSLSSDDCSALTEMYGRYCPATLGYPKPGTRASCNNPDRKYEIKQRFFSPNIITPHDAVFHFPGTKLVVSKI